MRPPYGPVLWALLLLLVATLPVGAQFFPGEEIVVWETFTSPDGTWSVEGPGAPALTEKKKGALRYAFPETGRFVTYTYDSTSAQDLLAKGQDAYFTGLLEALGKTRPVTSSRRNSVNGWPGVRFVTEGEGVTLHQQLVVYKRNRCIRLVLGTKMSGTEISGDIERFLGSLRIHEAAAPP